MSPWDAAFVGWPWYANSPAEKKTIRERPMLPVTSYRFERKSAQVFVETATTFLQVRFMQEVDGKKRVGYSVDALVARENWGGGSWAGCRAT